MVTERRVYAARRGQVAYGYSIGIVCLEYFLPFIPGDVGNASTYDFPVLYREVKGATFEVQMRLDGRHYVLLAYRVG